MESAKRACSSIIYGLKDCICGMLPIVKFFASQNHDAQRVQRTVKHNAPPGSIKEKLFNCVVFGSCFCASNFLFNLIFINYFFYMLVDWSNEVRDSAAVIWNRRILHFIFFLMYVCPLLAVSKLLNFIWYQDVADLILAQSGVRRNTDTTISYALADQIKSFILQMFYCLQGYGVYFLPLPEIFQYMWYLFHLSLLTSLYAFEYKWVHIGLPLHRRLLNINRKWPYYLGFGLLLALVTTFFESFTDSMVIFATLFPLYIVSSAVTPDIRSPVFSHPLNTFVFADSASDMLITFFMKTCAAGLSFFKR